MVTTSKTSDSFEPPPRIARGVQVEGRVNGGALSFAQERLWLLSQINPEDAAANIARAVSLAGPLNRAVLERILLPLIHRHEIFRTTFATTQLYAGIDRR